MLPRPLITQIRSHHVLSAIAITYTYFSIIDETQDCRSSKDKLSRRDDDNISLSDSSSPTITTDSRSTTTTNRLNTNKNRSTFPITTPTIILPQIISSERTTTLCDESPHATPPPLILHPDPYWSSPSPLPPPLSLHRRLFTTLRLLSLPTPRLLTPHDPCFNYCQPTIKKRQQDDVRLRALERQAHEARLSRDAEQIAAVVKSISEVAYGKGVTPQMRQDFLIKYGCAAYDDAILSILLTLGHDRGIIEVGAGQGQWARALSDRYRRYNASTSKKFEFVMACDDMSSPPLHPSIYHSRTQPYHDYFYPHVRQCHFTPVIKSWEARGRVLLLVYPPPGSMAVEAVREYVSVDKERNDTVVYVGEGRGGANADEAFFDLLLNKEEEGGRGEWVLVMERELEKRLGDKGCEKLFALRRRVVEREVDMEGGKRGV